jgi:hypothetical protein
VIYLKADGTTVLKYPYTAADLQIDNPNTSFSQPIPDENFIDFGASVVEDTPPPAYDPMISNLTEIEPTYSQGIWSRTWLVSPASPEEIEERQQIAYNRTKSELAVYYDSEAQSGGFADRNACVARAGYAGTYQAHGQVFGAWMDDCNDIALALTPPLPPTEDIIAMFPPLEWPQSTVVFSP